MTYLSLSLRGEVVLLCNIYQFDEITWQRCTDMTYFRISKMITRTFQKANKKIKNQRFFENEILR